MITNGKNECIHCTINNCANHAKDSDYCSLDRISVGTHETDPTVKECTDCESFQLKSSHCGCKQSKPKVKKQLR